MTALLPTIEASYQVTHAQSGLLMTSYFYPYALMQIPIGALSDRYSRKGFSAIGLFGSSIASLALLFAQSFAQMIVFRAIAGFFASLWYAPALGLLTLSVSSKHRGKAIGIALSGASAADAIAFLAVSLFGVDAFGWRSYFVAFSIPGFACALATWVFLTDVTKRPEDFPKDQASGETRAILKNQTVLRLLVFFAVFSLARDSIRTFLPTYLVQVRGLTASSSSLLMLAYATAFVLAGPTAGYLLDRFGYARPSAISFMAMSVGIFAIPLMPTGIPIAATLFAWGLMGSWVTTTQSVLLIRHVPSRLRGTFLGIQNSCTFLGSATGPLILGYAADIGGFGTFFVLALGLSILLATVMFPILRAEMRPRQNESSRGCGRSGGYSGSSESRR